ncbi:hypothetical protein [Paenibacillus sp. J2TS4]|uniref:hypothetical protein n=1 Tax=Paenibacillus sp. J2TS4 TaxID=2807194 RepID=UPI001B12DC59|nr:hypothetical protein [Paenibacillus sp. J2TS4]GIP35039.1 hypothetical protein J2TS4_42490 [Paenibacillus sp. J2TS4]
MKDKKKKSAEHEPTVAPGLEIIELDENATEEEIKSGDYTPVTSLGIDRTPDDD